jgi:integrase
MEHGIDVDALRCWAADIRVLLERFDALVVSAPDSGETVDQWIDRWYRHRDQRVSRPREERRSYEIWIQPVLGSRPVARISRSDVELWVEHIDRCVDEGQLRWGTAIRLWSYVKAMIRDMSASKVRELRVRSDNPSYGVRAPDRDTRRASTFLYPSEFLRFATCRRVKLSFRRLVTVAIYLYPRAGELKALTWSDFDLRTGRVHVHQSLKSDGKLGRTKTMADRQFVAERSLLPLLRVMFDRVRQPHNLARLLRAQLERAGLDRADLYADDDSRRPFTFHDLRATGITWMAMRGDSPADIMERVGHSNLGTTERYIRRGRLLVSRRERVFPTLPPRLLTA